MGFDTGHKKLGGRKKGTPNKKIDPLKEKVLSLGVDPFDVLLLFAKGDWKALGYESEKIIRYSKDIQNEEYVIQPAVRAKAAAEACQYILPKLKAIEHSIDNQGDGPQVILYLPSNGSESPDDVNPSD